MRDALKQTIEKEFSFRPNKNQLKDIERLVFEIIKRENVSLAVIINQIKTSSKLDKYTGRNKFFAVKEELINRRFPLTSQREKIAAKKVFLSKVREPLADNWPVKTPFTPLKIFVEKEVAKSSLAQSFKKKFPAVEAVTVTRYSEYRQKNKFTISQLKKPLVFIIKEKWDFLKPCPCTKSHVRCGYWILNLGFGCPYDCSYCFLQQYTNFPGIVLPANLEDFFVKFDAFTAQHTSPLRIGTGEFCDSLAIDDITGYSKQLISYFRNKNVFFELKTKSAQITNLRQTPPAPNIIISWSLNPDNICRTQEQGTAPLEERLRAAQEVQNKGYRVGFHFDPIIYSPDWQILYRELIDKLYLFVKPALAWISLGTLRSHRELKTIVEARFPQSAIFYEELFLGEDRKLRYPQFLRQDIYKIMVEAIRKHDQKTPIYLCMENKEMWQDVLGKFTPQDILLL